MGMSGVIDVKAVRDKLVSKKAINEQNRLRSEQAVGILKKIFASFDEKVLDHLESKGIYARQLLNYDLNRIYTDKDYNKKFMDDLHKIVRDIEEYLVAESGEKVESKL